MSATQHFNFKMPPKATYKIYITDHLEIHQPGKMPNIWHRFWMKLLLGWKMETLK